MSSTKERELRKMSENKIRSLVLGLYRSIADFAREVNWSRQKATRIINGKTEPSLDDIYVISRAVNKDADEIASIFLQQKTQKCDRGAD